MTSRPDFERLTAVAGALHDEFAKKGQRALDVLAGWAQGPLAAPSPAAGELCTCGHTTESHYNDSGGCLFGTLLHDGTSWSCPCVHLELGQDGGPAADDRRDEMRRVARAAEQHAEHLADLRLLVRVATRIFQRHDMAIPPDMSELRNRLTGEFDPETATDALAAGFCPNCWAAAIKYVPLSETEGKGAVRRYADRCRPCGDFRAREGIDKPAEIVRGHAATPVRRFSENEYTQIMTAARAAANPTKKGKRSKRKKAA